MTRRIGGFTKGLGIGSTINNLHVHGNSIEKENDQHAILAPLIELLVFGARILARMRTACVRVFRFEKRAGRG